MSAKKALESYYARQLAQLERVQSPRLKNAKPEEEVKRVVMAWLKEHGFSCHVVEAKAVYSKRAGRYVSSQTTPGFSDIVGACPNGLAAFIELKAPGKRSTLREGQRAFLVEKIDKGAFAVCVDSVECLATVWEAFEHRVRMEPQLARALLLRHLPQERSAAEDEIFE